MTPKRERGTEFCIVVASDGVSIYGNRAAMRSIATWMASLASSDPSEHYECHLVWHLTWHFRKKKNVWVLFQRSDGKRRNRRDFEVTFMTVEAKDLKALRRYERQGWLPASWRRESDAETDRPRDRRVRGEGR